jgi:hypothetical protein
MASESQNIYRRYCESNSERIPLWGQPYFWDAVIAKWDVAIALRNERLVAVLVYGIDQKWFWKRVVMPPLVHRTFLYLDYPPEQKYHSRLSYEIELMSELIFQLPKADYLELNADFPIINGLAFHHAGFELRTRYVYLLEGLDDLKKVYDNLKSPIRTALRRQDVGFEIIKSEDLATLYRLNLLSFDRQGFQSPYTLTTVESLDQALQNVGKRALFLAMKDGQAIGGIYIAWDTERAYGLLSGIDPAFLHSGVGTHLYWHAIRYTSEVLGLKCFDFVGSMHPTIEPARRKWGGRLCPYLNIRKINSRLLRGYYGMKG